MATLTASGVVFGDGTTINGTALLQVGSVAQLYNFSRTGVLPGDTSLSSASLGYASSGTALQISTIALGQSALRGGNVTVPGTPNNANSPTTTAVPGSWRSVSGVRASIYEGYANWTNAAAGLFVRVA